MKCYNCTNPADFKCEASSSYLCEKCIGTSIKANKGKFEMLDLEPNKNELNQLKLKTILKLQQIKSIKSDLNSHTQSLIKHIEGLRKHSIKLLENLAEKYFEILKLDKYCKSLMPKIVEIEKAEIVSENFANSECRVEIGKFYPAQLRFEYGKIFFMGQKAYGIERAKIEKMKKIEDEKNAKLVKEKGNVYIEKISEMNLKMKISYLLPVLKEKFGDVEDCNGKINEIFVSNNGKFYFICILYSDFTELGRF